MVHGVRRGMEPSLGTIPSLCSGGSDDTTRFLICCTRLAMARC